MCLLIIVLMYRDIIQNTKYCIWYKMRIIRVTVINMGHVFQYEFPHLLRTIRYFEWIFTAIWYHSYIVSYKKYSKLRLYFPSRHGVRVHHRFSPVRYTFEKVVTYITSAHAIGLVPGREEIKPRRETRAVARQNFSRYRKTL